MTLLSAIIFSLALGCAVFVIWDAAVHAAQRGAMPMRAVTWITMATVLIMAGLLLLIWTQERVATPSLFVLFFQYGAW